MNRRSIVRPLFVLTLLPFPLWADEASLLMGDLRAASERTGPLDAVAETRFAAIPEGWTSTGLSVTAGQGVTLFAFATPMEEADEEVVRPEDVLWVRVGDDDTFNVGSDTDSFVARTSGELQLAIKPRNLRFEDCRGTFPSEALATGDPLEIAVVAATWETSIEEGLAALHDQAQVARALEDFRSAPVLPNGFQSLCHLAQTRLHSAWQDGDRVGVRGTGTGRAEIIEKPLDLPLTDQTEIRFDWRYDSLPALGPETEARFHDYSSIAIEFDNGQDITWMWSGHVDAGTSFRCPLPWWDQRETHIVLQSGAEGLGEWVTHTRNIARDYDRAVGGKRPERIVGVWFIANGAFGQTTPDATFANVTLLSGARQTAIFE